MSTVVPESALSASKVVIGIIGGLGPAAGASFYKRLIELTPARDDQEHLNVVLISRSDIPSRVDHLAGRGPSPEFKLIEVARALQSAGATLLVIPSSTTHAYYPAIARAVAVPVVHLPREVAKYTVGRGWLRVGLLVTQATIDAGLYQQVLHDRCDIEFGSDAIRKQVQDVIHAVKAGLSSDQLSATLDQILRNDCWDDCDGIVLGCTELCTLEPSSADRIVVSAFDVLAKAVLEAAERQASNRCPAWRPSITGGVERIPLVHGDSDAE
jgi:aspartate racemase